MGSVSLGVAVDRPHLIDTLLRLLDRPARSALDLARRPLSATLAPALLGTFLVAAASALAGCITLSGFRLVPRLDVLRAVFEALLVVVPGTTVFAVNLRLRIPPRAFLAATALGLLAAGVVATCILPLMGFIAVVAVSRLHLLPRRRLRPADQRGTPRHPYVALVTPLQALSEPLSPFVPWSSRDRTPLHEAEPSTAAPERQPLLVDLLREPSAITERLLDPSRLQGLVLGSAGIIAGCTSFFAAAASVARGKEAWWGSAALTSLNVLMSLAASLGPIYATGILLAARVPLARLVAALLAAQLTLLRFSDLGNPSAARVERSHIEELLLRIEALAEASQPTGAEALPATGTVARA